MARNASHAELFLRIHSNHRFRPLVHENGGLSVAVVVPVQIRLLILFENLKDAGRLAAREGAVVVAVAVVF